MSQQVQEQSMDTTTTTTTENSKITYTRASILSFTQQLNTCKELPTGIEPSVLREIQDVFYSKLEKQWIPGNAQLYSFRTSDSNSLPLIQLELDDNSRQPCGRWDNYSFRPNYRGDCSQDKQDSDSGRHGDLSRPALKNHESDGLLGTGALPRVSGWETGVSALKIEENNHYQLKKSDNPYRPPHANKGCNVNAKANPLSGKTNHAANTYCDSQEKNESEKLVVSWERQHETENVNAPVVVKRPSDEEVSGNFAGVVKKSCRFSDFLRAPVSHEDGLIDRDADKEIEGNTLGMASQQSSILIPEHFASALKVDIDCSSTYVEKTASPCSAPFSEFKMPSSDGHSVSKIGSDISELNISLEGNTGKSEKNRIVKPTFGMDFKEEIRSNEATFSVQGGSGDRITRNNILEPCDSSFTVAELNFLTSVLNESGAIGINHEGVMATSTCAKTETRKIEEDQCAFEDAWDKISAIIPMENELKLSATSKCNNITDSEVEICLPDEDSLLSIDYMTISELPKSMPDLESVFIESSSRVLNFSLEENTEGSSERITRNYTLEPCDFSFTIAELNFLTSILNESGALGMNHGEVRATRISEKTDLDKIEEDPSASDDALAKISTILQLEKESKLSSLAACEDIADSEVEICLPAEDSLISMDYQTISEVSKSLPERESILQMDQDSKLKNVAGCDKKADLEPEICWPDEDSLITINDLLAPQCSESLANGDSVKYDMLTSNITLDISDKSAALYVSQNDERSTGLGLEAPPPHPQLYYRQSDQAQMNRRNLSFNSLNSHQPQMSCQTKLTDPKTIACYPTLHKYPCINVRPQPLRKTPPPQSNGFDLVQYSLLQQPTIFSPQPQDQLLIGAALADPFRKVACYTQGLNPVQFYLPLNYPEATFQGFGMPTPGYKDLAALNSFRH